jgi:hypothetical protein
MSNLLAFGKDVVGGSNIGHKILNRIKIALTQRPALWFKDAHVTDDAGNSSTDVEIITDITSAQFTALATDGSTEGAYNITDEDVIPTDAEYIGYDHTASGMSANNVQDAIDELNADLGDKSSASEVTGNDAFSKIATLNSRMFKVHPDTISAGETKVFMVGVGTIVAVARSGYASSVGILAYNMYIPLAAGNNVSIAYSNGALVITNGNTVDMFLYLLY